MIPEVPPEPRELWLDLQELSDLVSIPEHAPQPKAHFVDLYPLESLLPPVPEVAPVASKLFSSSIELREAADTPRSESDEESADDDRTRHTLEDGTVVSTLDRVMKTVPPPITVKPSNDQFFSREDPSKPNLQFLKQHFFSEGRLTEAQALWILGKATLLLQNEPNLLTVPLPATICSDIRGQYYDLMKVFEIGGDPIEPTLTRYLFLGNYYRRGDFGIECILYLWALKICYPDTILLLRGNHECRQMAEEYTFKLECKLKYSERVYEMCLASFHHLPLAALLDQNILCVHGGLSPTLRTLADLQEINRFREPLDEGMLLDVLWSDPMRDYGEEQPDERFAHNSGRNRSYFYSYQAVCDFLAANDLLCLIRGHEAHDSGYRIYKKMKETGFPSIIGVFSAPNYLLNSKRNNKASVIVYDRDVLNIRQFNYSPRPYRLPDFLDGIEWSLPFVAQKLGEMVTAMLSVCAKEELEGVPANEQETAEATKPPFAELCKEAIQGNTLTVLPRARSASRFRDREYMRDHDYSGPGGSGLFRGTGGEYARGLDDPRFSSDNYLSDDDRSNDDLSHGGLNHDDPSDDDSLPPGFEIQGPSIAIRFA